MNIGNRLRDLRNMAGLTQEEVGEKIGVTKATVNRYETGEIDIKRTIAIKLADVLHSSPAYIMGWSDNPSDISKEEKPSENTDSVSDKKIIKIVNSLDEAEKKMALDYLEYLVARKKSEK